MRGDAMRTTLDIDPKLLEEVSRLTGEKSRSKAVSRALREYIERKNTEELIALLGEIDFAVEDWRQLRDGELGEER